MRGLGFLLFFAALFAFVALAIASPFMAQRGVDVRGIYGFYKLFCHELNSRSYCLFGSSVEDCTEDSSVLEGARTIEVIKNGKVGYKFPICSRDVGIYTGMLVSAFALLIAGEWRRKEVPEVWLYIAAIAPLAIDGGLQFIGLYESSNLVRLITGFLAGNASTYYLGPLFNILASKVLPE
ncbi:MAG: DUF2085 domain-containing protein [Candidatus Anstonellales archaeon]